MSSELVPILSSSHSTKLMLISTRKPQKASIPCRYWLGIINWAAFLWNKSWNVWPKNVPRMVSLLWTVVGQRLYRFFKTPSLRHQKCSWYNSLQGAWLIMKISPSRNSTFLSILQHLWNERGPHARMWNVDLRTFSQFFKTKVNCQAY